MTKFASAKFQNRLSPSYMVLRIHRGLVVLDLTSLLDNIFQSILSQREKEKKYEQGEKNV